MPIKVNISNKQNKIKIDSDTKSLIKKSCLEVLMEENFKEKAEVEVSIVEDEEIKQLNLSFRNLDKATDVLSFPLGENGQYDINPENGAKMLGDIVISIDHALSQGELYGHGIEREIAFLTVHSMLHLLGYDHVDDERAEKLMREKQSVILKNLGLEVK